MELKAGSMKKQHRVGETLEAAGCTRRVRAGRKVEGALEGRAGVRARANRFGGCTPVPKLQRGDCALLHDLSFLTADERSRDVRPVHFETGYSGKTDFHKLCVAPINLRKKLEGLIRREIECAARGRTRSFDSSECARRSRHDPLAVERRRRRAGGFAVRGICCLKPASRESATISRDEHRWTIPGTQPHLLFRNGGSEQIYAGSAISWGAILDRRVGSSSYM